MNKINFYLESRFNKVLKNAQENVNRWGNLTRAESLKMAMNSQVKYGRKGWNRNDTANHYDADGNLCLENLEQFDAVPIRDVSRREFDYSGYYADNFEIELIKPYIVKIKSAMGLYIAPAIAYNDSEIAKIYLSRAELVEKWESDHVRESTIFRMASAADFIAEREAERCRDDDAKFQAEQLTEDLKEENKRGRLEVRGYIQAIRDQRKIGGIVAPICDLIKSDILTIRNEIRARNSRIQALKDNYWLAVS